MRGPRPRESWPMGRVLLLLGLTAAGMWVVAALIICHLFGGKG